MSLADFQQRVDDLVRDVNQVIDATARDTAIGNAVRRYSESRPREIVVDATSTGGNQLDLPAGWESDFSDLKSIEYPIGSFPRSWLDMSLVSVYAEPGGSVIELPLDITAGEDARITYTQHHAVDLSTDTVPVSDQHAVACLAASILCGQLANYYATDGESTIQADSVDRRRKSDLYRSRERDYRTVFFKDVGLDEKRAGAASAVVNLQGSDSRGGDRLFHRRRYR